MNPKSTPKIGAPNKTYRGGFNIAVEVYDCGYKWAENLIIDNPLSLHIEEMTPMEPPWLIPKQDSSTQLYYPFHFPNLHREFASLSVELEDIVNFANKFGFLSRPHLLQDSSKEFLSKYELNDLMVESESFYFWEREILRIKNLLHLWELVKYGDVNKIEEELEFDLPNCEFSWRKKTSGVAFSLYEDDEFDVSLPSKTDDDNIDLVRIYLLKEINRMMAGHGSPELVQEKHQDEIEYYLYTNPHSLLSSIYVLFAQEIQGFDFYKFKRTPPSEFCQLCKKPIELMTETKKNCSKKCRKLASYRRHAESINAKKREKRRRENELKKLES
jgi:predicted nucleic acid-binding Zn ribbon protein